MKESNKEAPFSSSGDVAIAMASDAAIECVRAVESFSNAKAAWAAAYSEYGDDWYKHKPLDYRPYVIRLYRALWVGWDRIGGVWPQLAEAYREFHFLSVLNGIEKYPAPVRAWLVANSIFWAFIQPSSQNMPAFIAWVEWSEEFIPRFSSDLVEETMAWLECLDIDKRQWACMDLVSAIPTTTPTNSVDSVPPGMPILTPKAVLASVALVGDAKSLQELREDLEQGIPAVQRAWNGQKCKLMQLWEPPGNLASFFDRVAIILSPQNFTKKSWMLPVIAQPFLALESEVIETEYERAWVKLRDLLLVQEGISKGPDDRSRKRIAHEVAAAGDRIIEYWQRVRDLAVAKLLQLAGPLPNFHVDNISPPVTAAARTSITFDTSPSSPVAPEVPAPREASLGKKALARLLTIKRQIDPDGGYIGESPAILRVFEKIHDYNKTHDDIEKRRHSNKGHKPPPPVLLLGPTGVGKTTLARLIHDSSSRRDRHFELEQSASNRQGDFTIIHSRWAGLGEESGLPNVAKEGQAGLLANCAGGTIFVDEIGEATLEFQGFLLMVLDGTKISVASGKRGITPNANVRLIFATNCDLDQHVSDGRFRHDFLARIRQYSILIPPLAERREDTILFLQKEYQGMKIDEAVLLFLLRYDWPENVRQLKQVLEAARARADSASNLELKHLEVSEPPEHSGQPAAEIIREIQSMSREDQKGKAYQEAAKIFRQQGYEKNTGLYRCLAELFGVNGSTPGRWLKKYPL